MKESPVCAHVFRVVRLINSVTVLSFFSDKKGIFHYSMAFKNVFMHTWNHSLFTGASVSRVTGQSVTSQAKCPQQQRKAAEGAAAFRLPVLHTQTRSQGPQLAAEPGSPAPPRVLSKETSGEQTTPSPRAGVFLKG